MLDEVLERGEGSRPDPLHLIGNEWLEQPSERAAFQDDLGLTDQERLIALFLHRPFVRCASDKRNPHALVGEGPPFVPGKPALMDRDAAAEIAGALGADALRKRSLAAGIEDRL
jgi:hypothetical protein